MNAKAGWMLAAFLAMAVVQSAPGGSIWAKAGGIRPLHADDTAREVGDVLTIVINERSVVENETNRNLSKKSSRKIEMAGNADLKDLVSLVRGEKAFRFPTISMDSGAETKFDGKTAFDTDRSVVDQITVAVEDVLPNGNLVVLGTRHREVGQDKQTIQVSGIVRPSDITFSNTVSSSRLADFRLVLKIEGQERQFTMPGWFNRLLNWLNPF